MSDGVILNANTSTGATMATDDAGAAGHVQLMKLAISTDGSASLVPADGTNGIYVNVRNVNGNLTIVGPAADGAAVSGNPVRIAGSDGTNTQDISVTTSGHVHIHDGGNTITVDGTVGVSGTVTVDGSGVTQPVSNAGLTALNGAISGSEVQVDVVTSALPSGAASETTLAALLTELQAKLESGEAVELGATTLAALETINAAQSGTWNITNVSGTVSLPTGAATEATLDARTGALTETAPATDTASSGLNGRLQRIAQRLTTIIGLLPTALGAGGGLKVDGSGTALPVSGTVTANAGTGTQAVSLASLPALAAGTNNIGDVDVLTLPSLPAGSNTIGAVNIAAAQTLATVTTVSTVTNLSQLGGTAVAMNTGTRSAGTQRVTVATDDVVQTAGTVAEDQALSGNPIRNGARASTAIPSAMSADGDVVTLWADRNGALIAKPRPTATATLANVSGSASSVTLIASNTGRLGAIIVNDSSATLYLKYGSTASATSFTYLLQPGATWEMPPGAIYTGIITGIWTSATGAARTTELS